MIGPVSGQSILFSEDFDDPDGTSSGVSTEGLIWSTACTACEATPPGADYFEVRGSTLRGQDTNGPSTFNINNIDASACLLITFQFDYNSLGYTGSGNLECNSECNLGVQACSGRLEDAVRMDINCYNCWDFLAWEINTGSVNDNNVVLGLDCTAPASGFAISDPLCVQQAGADPSNVNIAITMSMWATNEFMEIDNVAILCYTEAEANAAGIAIPADCQSVCPDEETHVFEICSNGSIVTPAASLAAAETLWPGAASVSFHNTRAGAENGSGAITSYSGSATTPVDLFARVTYPDGCVVIGTLTLDFLTPDGNAGNDATLATCSNGTLNLIAALGVGISPGSFSDDDASGVNLNDPFDVSFEGLSNGTYHFTYTAIDDNNTPCPPDQATVTVNVTASPVADTPTDDLQICYALSPPAFTSNIDDINNQINGGLPLTYYLDMAGLNVIDLTSPIDQATLATTRPTTIYAGYSLVGCSSNLVAINVVYNSFPEANGPQTLEVCEATNGFGRFNLTELIDAISGGNGNDVDFYFNSNGIGRISNITNFSSTSETIYAVVSDFSGCSSSVVQVNLVVNNNPSVIATLNDPNCNNAADGAISLTLSNGAAPYDFDWGQANLDGQEAPSGLSAGTYVVTITDNNGCSTQETYTLVDPEVFTLTSCAVVMNASSATSADGIASIVLEGGSPDYTIDYTGPSAGSQTVSNRTATLTGLLPGDYTITNITDANGCTASANCTFSIDAPQNCSLTLSCSQLSPATGAAVADGTANVTYGGGASPFTIEVAGPVSNTFTNQSSLSLDLSSLLPGDYTITLTDAAGCGQNCSLTIDNTSSCGLSVLSSVSDINCEGANDGMILLSVTGNSGALDVHWSEPGHEGQLQLAVGEGSYSVTVTDQGESNCAVSLGDFTFVDPDGLEVSCSSANVASSPAAADGSGVVNFTGGVAPYALELNGVVTQNFSNENGPSFTFNNLSVGSYTVTVTDVNGCTNDCFFVVSSAGCPLSVTATTSNVGCNGSGNGSIRLTITDNNGAVNVDWDQDQYDGQQDISNLIAGSYSVTVTDAGGCSFPLGPIVITEPDPLSINCSNLNDVSHPNAMDGRASALVNGGTEPYQLILRSIPSIGSMNDTFPLVTAGAFTAENLVGNVPGQDYEFIVVDASGCRDTCGFSIFEPPCPNIFVNETITNIGCEGGATGRIELNVINAQEPITYSWTPNLPDTNVVEGLAAGNYQVVLTDSFGCTFAAVYPVTASDVMLSMSCMAISDESAPGASDGAAYVGIVGNRPPFVIEIIGPSIGDVRAVTPGASEYNFTNLEPGDYFVVVTDNASCITDTCFFSIEASSCMMTIDTLIVDADCSGPGQIGVSVNNGQAPFTFDWNDDAFDGQDTIEVAPGFYAVTITDANGCTAFVSEIIEEIDNTPRLEISSGLVACQEGTVEVALSPSNGSPNYTYYFTTDLPTTPQTATSSADTTITFPVPLGTTNSFSVRVDSITDANGCTTVVDEEIDYIVSAADSLFYNGNRCIDEVITIEGRDFSVSNPSDTFWLPGGSCGLLFLVDFNFSPPVVDTIERTLCSGDSLVVNNVVFDGNNREGLVNYGIPATTACDSTVYVRIDYYPVAEGMLSIAACEGDTVIVGNDYYTAANPNGITIFENAAATGCDSLVNVTVSFAEEVRFDMFGDTSICQGDSTALTFETTSNATFNIVIRDSEGRSSNYVVANGTSIFVRPENTTSYDLVSVSQIGGICPISYAGTVNVQVSRIAGNLEANYNFDGYQISCNGAADGGFTTTVTDGIAPYEYNWADGANNPLRNNLDAGVYELTITDAAGCELVFRDTLVEPDLLEFTPTTIGATCDAPYGRLIIDSIVGGVGPYELSTDGSIYQTVTSFPYEQRLAPGSYTVEVRDMADCPTTFDVFVPYSDELFLTLGEDITIKLGDSVLINALSNFIPDTVFWNPTEHISQPNALRTYVSPEESTRYLVTALDSNGCSVSASILISVDQQVPIYVPSAFSPNNDGINDVFRIYADTGVERINTFSIFNRWGGKVFEALDFSLRDGVTAWDGTQNGELLDPQVFVYYINARLSNGRIVELKGDVTLLR